MGLRPARIYRKPPKKPYTRRAQKKEKAYITGAPAPRISIFEMGNKKGDFQKTLILKVNKECAIRGNALEAARIASNSYLKKYVDVKNYYLKINVYPHHVLRYHPLAGVAQADRYYQGMSHPFGRPSGRAAIVEKNQEIITIKINEDNVSIAKTALERASMKLPVSSKIIIN